MIRDVDNIAFYALPYDGANILGPKSLSTNVIEGVFFVNYKAKSNSCWYFEIIGESVNLVLYAWVVIEGIVVKVVELRDVLL